MNIVRISLSLILAIFSAAAFAIVPPPTTPPEAPSETQSSEQAIEKTSASSQTETAEESNTPTNSIKPPHKGELVEGKSVNPYTYSPDEIPADPNNPAETDLRVALTAMGPVAIEWYQHVQTLSNPFFEGRDPGSRGNDLAAEYVEFFMKQAGLEPAFTTAGDASVKSFRQPFELQGGAPKVETAVVSMSGHSLKRGDQFEVIGSSGSGDVTAPLVFAGYAIEAGQDDYTSFSEKDDFSGKIVMFLRYEPLDEGGRSLWSDRRFSGYAGMRPKLDALADRKPAADMGCRLNSYA